MTHDGQRRRESAQQVRALRSWKRWGPQVEGEERAPSSRERGFPWTRCLSLVLFCSDDTSVHQTPSRKIRSLNPITHPQSPALARYCRARRNRPGATSAMPTWTRQLRGKVQGLVTRMVSERDAGGAHQTGFQASHSPFGVS